MSEFTIKGKVVFQNLGPGFWGITGSNGKKYRPINMPENLKEEGKIVLLKAKPIDEGASIYMWGIPIEILEGG